MAKEICISSTPHETRLAIIENDELAEIYYERENEYTLAGSIYKGRVTRVLPGMQSSFVDIGLERDAFLYVTDFLEEQGDAADFERIPAGRSADRSGDRSQDRPKARQRALSSRSAEQPEATGEVAPVEAAPSDAASRQVASGEEDDQQDDQRGARRWRGRRGRRRGGRLRNGAERGEASAADTETDTETVAAEPEASYGFQQEPAVDEAPQAAEETFRPTRRSAVHHAYHIEAPTPFVLPGESLSKYGGSHKAESAPATAETTAEIASRPQVTSRPSTLVENTAMNWDGGFVLPGESLSRHRRRAEVAPVVAAPIETAQVDTAQAETTQAEAFAEQEAVSETHAAAEVAPEAEAASEIEAAPAPEAQEEIVHEEEEHDFEPEEGSASHRIDLSAPSEFRVSTPEPEEVAPEAVTVEAHEAAGESVEEFATEETATEEAVGQSQADIFGYASGRDVFEEEEIDEDEYDFEHLHLAGMEEHDGDEMEEETLDQGSQLSDSVREEHLERRLALPENGEEVEEETAYSGTAYNGIEEIDEEAFDEESLEGEDHEEEDHDEEDRGKDAATADAAAPERRPRRNDRDRRGRRDGRQGGRGGRQGGGRRSSVQTMDLLAINELLKQGQEILVQIAKEPIAKKGARITSHIALPGRFLVFMPTVNHVGVSRKISSDEERQRLKRILISEKGDAIGGFIVRTAAEHASEDELRADIRFLINLWAEIKERSDNAKAPALIYHDLNLVERILRDQVSEQFSTIWVDSETDYERIVRFLNRVQPALVRRVKLYTKETPLFEQFGIQDEISKALKSKVWLKSGGSIVINQTEALVAIDINTGKYVGKTARLEDTILKTNLDAIPEIVRQIRLRDLGGIIVIDFIDMDERKNRHKVMQALEEELKNDRAPSKVLQFNDFGLVAITRKRVKQSLERTLSVPCTVCTGTGMVKSPVTVANEIHVEMHKMQKHFDRNDVLLRVHPEVVKALKANNGRRVNELEEMISKTIIIKSDPTLEPEQFDIH